MQLRHTTQRPRDVPLDELRQIIERAPARVAVFDRDLRYVLASRLMVSNYGLAETDVVGRHHYEVLPTVPERWREVHRRCLAGAVEHSDEDRFIRPDGTVDWVRWEVFPWHESSGKIGGIVVLSEVITEHRRAQELSVGQRRVLEMIATGAPLAETLDQLVRLIESQADGMLGSILLLEEGKRVRHAAGSSLPREYCEAIDGLEIGPDVGSCGTAAYLRKSVIVTDIAEDPLWDDYRAFALPHGLRACWSTPIVSTEGDVLGTFAMYYREPRAPDETHLRLIEQTTHLAGIAIERARAVEELARSEERYRHLVELSPDMIALQKDGRIVFVNRAGCRLLGATADELIGKPVLDIVHPSWRSIVAERTRRTSDEGTPVPFLQEQYLRLDGSVVDVEVAALPAEHEGRRASQFVVRDITERLRLETRMQQLQKLESLGLLAGGVAHDFNNLLVAMLGNAELALLDLPDGEARDRVIQIKAAAVRAAELTEQMLAYTGKARLTFETVDLSALVEEMTNLLEVSISRKAQLVRVLEHDLPLIKGDPTQLRQVVMNLITNASEALGSVPGTIRVGTGRLDADADSLGETHADPDLQPGPYVFLEVADTGCGMGAETRARIFDPFFTTKFAGRGLGLAAVHGIVGAHRGTVTVASEVGHGTSFRILLPSSHTSAPSRQPSAHVDVERTSGGTVLVVDDEPAVRAVARGALERAGLAVLEAVGGEEAISVFRKRSGEIDLVLLDVTMPVLSGDEVLRRLREIRPGVPVLLSSGYGEVEASEPAGNDAANGFVHKPYRPADLVARARELLQ